MDDLKASTFFFLLLLHASSLLFSGTLPVAGEDTNLLFPHPSPNPVGGAADDADSQLQTYIIHVKHPEDVHLVHLPELMQGWYASLLDTSDAVSPSTGGSNGRIVHSYSHAMTGFAARLTKQELEALSKMDWFVNAYPDHQYTLHTTHTPDFLGLHRRSGLWDDSNSGEGLIIGMIDSGVTPGHPSFDDEGMPPPPSRWKGKCEPPVVCNNKLIGARSFVAGVTPADEEGHGTHTASTAAGAFVKNASVSGNAVGTAVGMAPRAHLAIYKVCATGCASADILAGIGAAIRDGCDVISLSLGSINWVPFHEDPVAVGTFSAAKKGIFVSASAGNNGPGPSTLRNEVPWAVTVAASTIDRSIGATVKLGNGVELNGESLYQPKDFGSHMFPLVYAGDGTNASASLCGEGAFDGFDVKGKIVLCERGGTASRIDKGNFVKRAGGAGMILMNQEANGYSTIADPHVLPASHVGYSDGNRIKDYINSARNPTATIIFKGTVTGTPRAPVVTSFSSRGPNLASPGILKPDITGPGVSVLAAWPTHTGPDSGNQTGPAFNMISGTSMSCPHISGIAALVKVAHPEWSPAAIKSAIMTTAYTVDNQGDAIMDERLLPADLFTVGSGHVNVSRAADPGLVYDTDTHDYIPYLCGLGYNSRQVSAIANRTVACSTTKNITEAELNYPSMSVTLAPQAANFTVKRTVTNVGVADSTYVAEVDSPAGVSVVVKPDKLRFRKLHQKRKFRVIFTSTGGALGYAQGQLKWVSEKHIVRSPISIKVNG